MIWEILNWVSGSIFGTTLVASFLFGKLTYKKSRPLLLVATLSILVQVFLGTAFGFDIVSKSYPLIVHLPLLIICILYYKKSVVSSLTALLIAFIHTVPRNWLGDLMAFLLPNLLNCKDITKFAVTIPLLLGICRFLSPQIRKLLNRPTRELWMILIPGLLYYSIAYTTTVYTHTLYNANVVIIGFILTLVTLALFIYLSIFFRQLSHTIALEQQQRLIRVQSNEASKQIEELRHSQEQTKIMRHDLRHYFQMIDSMLTDDKTDEARSYIRTICTEINETIVKQYCCNESINLIISAYSERAKKQNINFSFISNLPQQANDIDLDLCILLANGIENAFHAAIDSVDPCVSVKCNYMNQKYIIEIKNPYTKTIQFEDGIPKSSRSGHGIGTASIVAITEKYHGMVKFHAENGVFVLQIVI